MKLVDARAICDLLSDNVDEHVSHFVVFTEHGTLLAHDSTLTRASLSNFAPFAGTTWRANATPYTPSDQSPQSNNISRDASQSRPSASHRLHTPFSALKIHDAKYRKLSTNAATVKQNGDTEHKVDTSDKQDQQSDSDIGLAQLTVEIDGVVSVIHPVLPRLLLAAQLGVRRQRGSTNTKRRRRRKSHPGEPPSLHDANGDAVSNEATGRGTEAHDGAGSQTQGPTCSDNQTQESGDDNDNDSAEDDDSECANSPQSPSRFLSEKVGASGITRLRVLELKAEGMARFLAGEYPPFIPQDFY